jgi:hypothetical protein
MESQVEKPIWVAVKVERGFIVEVRGFLKESDAEKLKRKWRRTMNPDYDEAEVLQLVMGED